MTWQVFSRPEAANDVIDIADWYGQPRRRSRRQIHRGVFYCTGRSLKESVATFQTSRTQEHPLALSQEFSLQNYYEVIEREKIVVVAAVLHAARHDRQWKRRV